MRKWSDCNPRVSALTTSKQSHWLCKKNNYMGKQHFGGPQPWVTTEHHHFMNGLYFALRSGDEHRQLRHKPCQIQVVENKGERPYLIYTEDTSKKNTQEDLKDKNSSPKLLCIMLTLRTRTDALFASSRSTMLSANTIVLKVHFILHHWRIPKRTFGTLFHLLGETNSLKLFQTCAKSVGFRGFEQTTHYVLQQQPAWTLQVLTNNLLWSGQAFEALRVFVFTSIH